MVYLKDESFAHSVSHPYAREEMDEDQLNEINKRSFFPSSEKDFSSHSSDYFLLNSPQPPDEDDDEDDDEDYDEDEEEESSLNKSNQHILKYGQDSLMANTTVERIDRIRRMRSHSKSRALALK